MEPSESHEAFLHLLNNGPRNAKSRDRGFIALVEEPRSLEPLQDACFRQSYNRCYTVRYRLGARAVFGSLAAVLLQDLNRALERREGRGMFRPSLSEISDLHAVGPFGNTTLMMPRIGAEQLSWFVEEIARRTANSIGSRFVLFAELADRDFDVDEWRLAGRTFLHRLPERVGLVFSGVAPEIAEIIRETGQLAGDNMAESAGAAKA